MADVPVLTYTSSKGEVLIAEMNYPHLVNAINKRARETGGGPDPVLDALRAEAAKRTRDGETQATPLQPPARGAPSRGPEAMTAPAADRTTTAADNAPPADADPLRERLEAKHIELLNEAAMKELEAGSLPAEVDSDEDCAAINKWIVDAEKVCRKAEAERKDEKEFYLKAGRTVDAFFGAVGHGLQSRIAGLKQRTIPFLRAKQAAEEAIRNAAAIALRASQQEALQRQQEEQAAAEGLRQAAEAARQRLINAETPEDIEAAEKGYRDAARAAHLSDQAAEQAVKDAKRVEKAVNREEKILSGEHTHVMGRVQGEGAAARLNVTWKAEVHNAPRLNGSLGPLAPFLDHAAIEAALKRAAKADPRPAIPGVDFVEEFNASVRATTR